MWIADVYGEFSYRKDVAVPGLSRILNNDYTSLPQVLKCDGLLLAENEKTEVTVVIRESWMDMREALQRASP